MKTKRILRAIAMAVCVAVLSAAFAGIALADDGGQDILDKQQQIDRYLFEDHSGDLAAMGITVTHTAPMEGYVEIGITPYSEKNADYLYGIFGADVVKVVEGEQAVIFTTGYDDAGILPTLAGGDAAVSDMASDIAQELLDKQADIDKYLFEDHKDEIAAEGITVTHTAPMEGYVEIGITPYSEESAQYLYGIFGSDMVKVVEGQQAYPLEAAEGNLVSTQDDAAAEAFPVLAIVLVAAALAAGIAFALIRRRAASR